MSQQKKDINFSTFSSHPPMALFSNILFSTYCMPGTVVILFSSVQFSSVAQSCPTLQPHGLQHIRLLCPSPPPRAYPNSCPLSPWCHPTISFSVVPFSSHLQSFPALGSFLISQFLASDGQSIGVFSFSISPSNEHSEVISFTFYFKLIFDPEYSSEGLMLKLKLQYLGHLIRRTDSLKKTLMLGKIEGRRRRGR